MSSKTIRVFVSWHALVTLVYCIFTGRSALSLLFFFDSGRRKSVRAKNRPFWSPRVKTDDSSRILLSNLGL